jgi:TPR repeat protein
MRRTLLFLLILFLSPAVAAAVPPASAESLEDGLVAYRKHDWPAAAKALQPLAEAGVAIAQERMGRLYQRGKGVPKDYALALGWYLKAAKQGEPFAQGHLGLMYQKGLGVAQSTQEAVRWYHLAAAQGNVIAQVGLGYIQLEGAGTPADPVMAANWFREAAEQGDASAMLALGNLFEEGKGVSKSQVQAYKWYSLAAVDDGEYDQELFDRAAHCRSDLEEKMSPTDLEAAKQLARAWRRPAAH